MAVGDMLQEITDYIENLTSAYGQNELVKLKEKNFQSLMGSRFLDFGLELSSYTPVGPFTSFVPTHPLHWYEPSRSWLEGKRAIRLEREKLEERMKSYFSRRKRTAISNNIGIALTAISVFNVFKNGAPVNLDDKKDDIREKTNKLNSQKISELSENLQKEYADLEKDLKKAEKANDDSKVLEINTKLNKILKQLEALDDDK
jgi:flagellin-specific chaperone FliS